MHSRGEKKTSAEAKHRHEVDQLVEGYEQLRESVLEGDAFAATRCGLSVLLSQGMASWMKVYRLLPQPRQPQGRVSLRGAPSELAEQVAELMADVFLCRKEVSRC